MSTTATATRGRPRQFDEEEVLDVLTSLFWQKGYESTSVADIAAAAGLNKSSLYNTFGPKQQLFTRILDRYINARMELLQALVAESGSGVDALHTFLEFVRTEVTGEMGANGCMAVNCSAELGRNDAAMVQFADTYRDRMRGSIRSLVEGAVESGELQAANTEHHANMLTAFMLGLSVAVRSGAGNDEVNALIDAAHSSVDCWAD